jgi:hypothetical protein
MTLESTLEYLEQIIKKAAAPNGPGDSSPTFTAEEGNRSCYLLIEADNQSQSENNMDNILRLWKFYLPLIKKSFPIQKEIAYRLYDSLNTYVIQGLQSLMMTTNSNNQQIGMKLQLLNFFLQRLCATLIFFQSHFGFDQISSCFFHIFCFQGYLSSHLTFLETYEAKLKDLCSKFFDSNFLLPLGEEGFERILFSISSKLGSNLLSGSCGLSTLIGTFQFVSTDLDLLETSTKLVSPLRINAYVDLFLTSVSLLTAHYCGLISDSNVSRYVTQLGTTLSNIILKMNQLSGSTAVPDTIVVSLIAESFVSNYS